jgi:hypothetical protein
MALSTEGAGGTLRRLLKSLQPNAHSGTGKKFRRLDKATQTYIEFAQRHWPARSPDLPRVVLLGFFDHAAGIHTGATFAHYLADRFNARVATSCFAPYRNARFEMLFAGMGAPIEVSFDNSAPFQHQAQLDAEEVSRSLKTRQDVLKISRQDIALGDLIYDTYLRLRIRATIDLHDPALKRTIYEAFLNHDISRAYLEANEVVAFIPNHTLFLFDGVLERLCARYQVPSFSLGFEPISLDLHETIQPGDPNDYRVWPTKWPACRPEWLRRTPPDQKAHALAWAREDLEKRFAGGLNYFLVSRVGTAFYEPTTAPEVRCMEETGRPRILLMMHDLCDGAHTPLDMLFDDFYQWAAYTLEKAAGTPYDWYVKPHPLRHDQPIDDLNLSVAEEFRRRFPHVRILPPSCSNLQLLREGVHALFTCCGTAGVEFSYFNVPVVDTALNPRNAFNFTFYAPTLEKYDDYIQNAGRLKIDIDKEQVLECHYKWSYQMIIDRVPGSFHAIPLPIRQRKDYYQFQGDREFLRAITQYHDDGHEAKIRACFDTWLAALEPELKIRRELREQSPVKSGQVDKSPARKISPATDHAHTPHKHMDEWHWQSPLESETPKPQPVNFWRRLERSARKKRKELAAAAARNKSE